MATLLGKAIRLTAKTFDIQRKLFSEATRCRLLRADGTVVSYELIQTIEKGWFLDFSNYRQTAVLFVASVDQQFLQILEDSGHLAIDEQVYVIASETDVSIHPPTPEEPYFKIFCRRTGETFA